MTQIGFFTPESGGFRGVLRTLSVDVELWIMPNEAATTEHAPDYHIHLGDENGPNVGAGWKRVGEKAGDYIAVQLDDPFLPQPLRANLFQSGVEWDTHILLWNRAPRRSNPL